jgi:TPR repeat protein
MVKACDAGNAMACMKAGTHEQEKGNNAVALRALERACDISQSYGCPELAELLLDGSGVAHDPARARKLLDGKCADGNPVACFAYAKRLRDGRGMNVDHAEALRAFEQGCDLGGPQSCMEAAALLTPGGSTLTPDPAHAAALRKQSCSIDATSCPHK